MSEPGTNTRIVTQAPLDEKLEEQQNTSGFEVSRERWFSTPCSIPCKGILWGASPSPQLEVVHERQLERGGGYDRACHHRVHDHIE